MFIIKMYIYIYSYWFMVTGFGLPSWCALFFSSACFLCGCNLNWKYKRYYWIYLYHRRVSVYRNLLFRFHYTKKQYNILHWILSIFQELYLQYQDGTLLLIWKGETATCSMSACVKKSHLLNKYTFLESYWEHVIVAIKTLNN